MANPTVFPAELSFAGIAKETSNGTAVAPLRYMPFTKLDPVDNINILIDDAVRGSMMVEYGAVPGPQIGAIDLSTYFFADTLGDLLYNLLGGYAVGTAVTGVLPHTFTLLNSGDGQPPAHTIVDRQGVTATVGARAYSYACLSELTISGNATTLVTVDGKFTSYASAPAAAAPTNAVTTETPVPGWRTTASVGGSAQANVRDWSITLSRALNVVDTADGSADPYAIVRGGLTISGKLTFATKDESPVTAYRAGTQQPFVLTVDSGGTGANVRSLALTMTKGIYSDLSMQRDTPLGYAVGFKGIGNSTDVGASAGLGGVSCLLKNAITTY